ncbi:MAG: O-antigen ligase family protein [Clostridia bacterium]|nr:O-antigen ligase family protein [Clostridia bacterium]
MAIKKSLKSLSFAQICLYAALLLVGTFHVYLSCVLAAALLIWLLVRLCRSGALRVPITLTGIAVAVLVGGYAVTPLWAVDGGDAVFGFFKFLPVLLYTLVLAQEENGRDKVLDGLPYMAAGMTVLSAVGMQIPALHYFFSVADRLGGFLQYPNTYALVLLVAQLWLVTKERPRLWDYVSMAVLLAGVLYTGSRTVLVLTVVANGVALLLNKNRRVRWITLGCVACGVAAVLVYCGLTDNFAVLARYLRFSVSESTLVGRFLYAYDALPLILRHPFGLGYMGYYHLEQSVQTGVYSVLSVHNDLLQIMLDVGWIPALLLVAAAVRVLLVRTVSVRYKLIMTAMLAHACFDFDLQYVAVFILLMVVMADPPLREATLRKKGLFATGAVVLTALSLYMGTAQCLNRFLKTRAAYAMYPASLSISINRLNTEEEAQERERIADKILERNPDVPVACVHKAANAYAKGDFGQVIRYMDQALTLAPFSEAEYIQYAQWLRIGVMLYEQAGSQNSADICKDKLVEVSHRLQALPDRLSPLGKKIVDQPDTSVPEELAAYIAQLAEEGYG